MYNVNVLLPDDYLLQVTIFCSGARFLSVYNITVAYACIDTEN